MGIFDSISEWFNNTLIKATYDPLADQLKQVYRENVFTNLSGLRQTASFIGGGLGSSVLSIPGVSDFTTKALSELQTESENLLKKANNMTPDQIAKENDKLQQKAYELQERAKKEGKSIEDIQEEEDPTGFSFRRLFNRIFENVLYLGYFVVLLILAFLTSRMLSNYAFVDGRFFVLYYAVYGFVLPLFGGYILFRNYLYDDKEVTNYMNYLYGFALIILPLILGFSKMNNPDNKIHALWAPIINGFTSNIYINTLLFPFVYNETTNYDKTYKGSDIIQEDAITQPQQEIEQY
jgi:hypothetical protein